MERVICVVGSEYGCVVHEWNATGYDLLRSDRWLYAFATPDHALVKIGMVLVESRLRPRLTEVRRKSGRPELVEVWRGRLPNTTHEEAEHLEAVVRHWLTGSAGFAYVGEVDWLATPFGFNPADWSQTLSTATLAAIGFGR